MDYYDLYVRPAAVDASVKLGFHSVSCALDYIGIQQFKSAADEQLLKNEHDV